MRRATPNKKCDATPTIRRQPEKRYPRTGKRGAPQVFPRKVHEILTNESADIVTWNAAGTTFRIMDMETFTSQILLAYFRHQKYSSFQRQLNLYGFRKIQKGPETGAYAHDCFLRDKPEMLHYVRRCSVASLRPLMAPPPSPTSAAAAVDEAAAAPNDPRNTSTSRFSLLTSCFQKPTHESSEEEEDDEEDGDDEEEENATNHSNQASASGLSAPMIQYSFQRTSTVELFEEYDVDNEAKIIGEAVLAHEIGTTEHLGRGMPLRSIPSDDSEKADEGENDDEECEAVNAFQRIVRDQPGASEAMLLPLAQVSEAVENLALSSPSRAAVVEPANATMVVVRGPAKAAVRVRVEEEEEEEEDDDDASSFSKKMGGKRSPSQGALAALIPKLYAPQFSRSGSNVSLGFSRALDANDKKCDIDGVGYNRAKTLSTDSLGSMEPAFSSSNRFSSVDWELDDGSVDIEASIDKNFFERMNLSPDACTHRKKIEATPAAPLLDPLAAQSVTRINWA
jgi:hypothetical protein